MSRKCGFHQRECGPLSFQKYHAMIYFVFQICLPTWPLLFLCPLLSGYIESPQHVMNQKCSYWTTRDCACSFQSGRLPVTFFLVFASMLLLMGPTDLLPSPRQRRAKPKVPVGSCEAHCLRCNICMEETIIIKKNEHVKGDITALHVDEKTWTGQCSDN
jgi:hypothetical protein